MRKQPKPDMPCDNKGDYIETYTGKKFFVENPVFDIVDISHALSMVCRYSGHCKRRYSVAEHSVLVSLIVEDYHLGDPFEGLMHDAQEAYIGDIARPWKPYLPDYKKLEAGLEAKLRAYFGIAGAATSPGVKIADMVALALEAREIIPSGGADWGYPPEVMALLAKIDAETGYHIMCWDVESAKREFMGRFKRLQARVTAL